MIIVKAEACTGRDLCPGDLFSTAPPEYWRHVDHMHSIGEKVYIRMNGPATAASDLDATIYRITIEEVK